MWSSSSSPFDNSLVVRMILSHLSAEDLLELSNVNKLWNYEARCLLRDHRKFQAFIKEVNGVMPCARAKVLNDQIENMGLVPNALSVHIRKHECPREMMDKSVEDIYATLINKLDLKHLQILWYDEEATKNCILGQLLLRFLCGSPQLESLDIGWMPVGAQLTAANQSARPVVGLPKLRSLKLPEEQLEEFLSSALVKELVTSLAPNLQVLDNTIKIDLLVHVPEEKFGIVKRLSFPSTLEASAEVVNVLCKFAEIVPRLEGVSFYHLAKYTRYCSN